MGTVVVAQVTVTCSVRLAVHLYRQTFVTGDYRRAGNHRRRVVRRLRRHHRHRRRCRINNQFSGRRVVHRVTGTVRHRRHNTVRLTINKTSKRTAADRRIASVDAPHPAYYRYVAVGRPIHHDRQRFPTAYCCSTANNRSRVIRCLRHHYRQCRRRRINNQFASGAVACGITGTIRHRRHNAVPPFDKHIN